MSHETCTACININWISIFHQAEVRNWFQTLINSCILHLRSVIWHILALLMFKFGILYCFVMTYMICKLCFHLLCSQYLLFPSFEHQKESRISNQFYISHLQTDHSSGAKIYVEDFMISDIKVRLSFSMLGVPHLADVENTQSSFGGDVVDFLLSSVGMTLTEVTDIEFRWVALLFISLFVMHVSLYRPMYLFRGIPTFQT